MVEWSIGISLVALAMTTRRAFPSDKGRQGAPAGYRNRIDLAAFSTIVINGVMLITAPALAGA
jgi:hypothetical protein